MSSSPGLDQNEAQDYGGSGFVRSVIKVFTGSRFKTPEESPRNSPSFDPLLNAEKSDEAQDDSTEERAKRESVGGGESSSPIATLPSELRQDQSLTFRGEVAQLQSVPRPVSEGHQNSRVEGPIESRPVFGRLDGAPAMPQYYQPSIQSDVVGNLNYDALFDTTAPRRVQGGERELGRGYLQPVPPFSNVYNGDRNLDGCYSRVFPQHPFQPTAEHSPAGTVVFREQDFPRQNASVQIGSTYKGFNEDLSSRLGRNDGGNVTQRDTKRPKERSRDKAYKARFSLVSTVGRGEPLLAGFTTMCGNGQGGMQKNSGAETPLSPGPPRQSWETGYVAPPSMVGVRARASATPSADFEIFLTHSGTTVIHRVWNEMPIAQLMAEAGSIFGLDSSEMILVLFSSQPISLQRERSIMGPPRVTPGSNVMVFNVYSSGSNDPYVPTRTASHGQGFQPPHFADLPVMSTKLLATFKLPKFDGVARTWKAWEKSFQRFLGIHALDHVLEEDFPNILWTVPGAMAANKMVYFLIEDAVATGTLASKLIRQATKWHGHEAFTLLRNGYVFNGPQTATILLAELSNMRLKRDEDASTFCLRLVELIEDLELIPGEAAVYLTDIQKLGYLLSAIRHEKSLQAVYSQLQSEQLRGTVSFDQACRELHHRVEAMRADDFLDSRPGRALLSTENKKNGQLGEPVVKVSCLAKDCVEMVQPYLPLCKLCYLQCMAGKTPTLPLRDNLGTAIFNSTTKRLDFPSAVPKSRFPKKGLKKGKKVLMAGVSRVSDDGASSSTVVDQN
jgi:hypothetical protein